jgi:hypothetical protein
VKISQRELKKLRAHEGEVQRKILGSKGEEVIGKSELHNEVIVLFTLYSNDQMKEDGQDM